MTVQGSSDGLDRAAASDAQPPSLTTVLGELRGEYVEFAFGAGVRVAANQ